MPRIALKPPAPNWNSTLLARARPLQALVRSRSVPPDGSRHQLKPPNPLRPSRAIGTRRMTRVQQHAFRSGERHAQHNRRLPPTRLPDIAGDRLGLKRSILTPEPMGCRVEVER